jgi:hypothetical protein
MTNELERILEELGLKQYLENCLTAGFDDWETLSNITESDLVNLNIRLGHRRKLQREIARRYLWPDDKPLPTPEELQQHAQSLARQTSLPRIPGLSEEGNVLLTSSTRSPYSGGSSLWSPTLNDLEISFNSVAEDHIRSHLMEMFETGNLPLDTVASIVSKWLHDRKFRLTSLSPRLPIRA